MASVICVAPPVVALELEYHWYVGSTPRFVAATTVSALAASLIAYEPLVGCLVNLMYGSLTVILATSDVAVRVSEPSFVAVTTQ